MEIPDRAEIVIIGSGIIGLSTAYYLACRGCRNIVILEEKAQIGGQTTQKCGGGFRFQFASSLNIQLSQLSYQLLKDLEQEAGFLFPFQRTGYLFVVTEKREEATWKQAIAMQNKLGVHSQWLSPAQVRSHLPMLCLDGVQGAAWHADDGWISPFPVVKAYQTLVVQKGIRLFPSTKVRAIQTADKEVRQVFTTRGCIATPLIINATGPWAAHICRMVGHELPLRPIQHQVCILSSRPEFPSGLPTIIFPQEAIGFRHNGPDILAGMTDDSIEAEPGQPKIKADLEQKLLLHAARRLPAIEAARPLSRLVGFYDSTPDQHAIIGQLPSVKGLYCIAGFNGHGFMHAPACGLLLSEEITQGHAHTLNISPLHPERF
jgi:sarcosine oxidase subunit beta